MNLTQYNNPLRRNPGLAATYRRKDTIAGRVLSQNNGPVFDRTIDAQPSGTLQVGPPSTGTIRTYSFDFQTSQSQSPSTNNISQELDRFAEARRRFGYLGRTP